MATVSPQYVDMWELGLRKAVVKENFKKITPLEDQEQSKVQKKDKEQQHAYGTSCCKGSCLQKLHSKVNVSVCFKWSGFADMITAKWPSLCWVPHMGHSGLRDCSCVSWQVGSCSPGHTPPWTSAVFICWQIVQGILLCKWQLKGIKLYSKSFSWSLECVNTEPQTLTEENQNLFYAFNCFSINGPV